MIPTLNLTQHATTPDQKDAGVFDLPDDVRERVSEILTFDAPPTGKEMSDRAGALVPIALKYARRPPGPGQKARRGDVMISGVPFFMPVLAIRLKNEGLSPKYPFSKRTSVDVSNPDGSVTKTSVFRHVGWVFAT